MKFPQVYIVCGYTDMRRSIDGLAAVIKQNFIALIAEQSLYVSEKNSYEASLTSFLHRFLLWTFIVKPTNVKTVLMMSTLRY